MPFRPFSKHDPLELAKAAFGQSLARLNYWLGAPVTRRPDGSNVILMYHSIGDERLPLNASVNQLDETLQFLTNSSRIQVVDLPEVTERTHCTRKVALTFDDGFSNFYDNAVPLLNEYKIPATVFVNPGFVEDHPTEVIQRRHDTPKPSDIVMSKSELRDLAAHPLITIGNHTVSHPKLDMIDIPTIREEVVGGQRDLEAWLDVPITRFAYPYGRYDDRSLEIVRETHELAVAVGPGVVTSNSDIYRLPRILADRASMEIRWRMTRASYFFSTVGSSTP